MLKYLILIICPGLNFSLRQHVSRNRVDRLFVSRNDSLIDFHLII